MDSGYEKRLMSSPYTTPDKTNSPVRSPTKELLGDRYIPVRSNVRWKIDFRQANRAYGASLAAQSESNTVSTSPRGPTSNVNGGGSPQTSAMSNTVAQGGGGMNTGGGSARMRSRENLNGEGRDMEMYRRLLDNEVEPSVEDDFGEVMVGERKVLQARENSNMFSYKLKLSPHKLKSAPYSLSPVSDKSQRLLKSPRKQFRKIPKVPYKVLDAPELQDDFYLNLVDWSSQNILAVGLGTCVYLWSAVTSQVTRLCDVGEESDSITSVAWSEKGGHVAVGTYRGNVHIWDVAMNKRVKDLDGHNMRVGALAWNGDLLASGSRDRHIMLRDTRSSSVNADRHLREHRQEVCGLKWSPDHQHLASGGNDNRLFVWNLSASSPVQTYTHHIAAVKAIAWSPHQHGLLASGGGTADRCIKFWNTLTGQPLQSIDTASQVCNLAWSIHSNELVSTHGYSQNQILVWKYPSLTQLAKLTGHTYRVLFLAMSPDGESIVTGAGDETLRFWNIFTKAKQVKPVKSNLHLFGAIR